MVTITRREFTAGVGAAVAGMALTRSAAAATHSLEIGVQSYSFRAFSVEQMIEAMKSIGLASVELWDGHLDPAKANEADYKATRDKFAAAGIKINAYCVNFAPEASDELIDKSFRGAGLLGTKVMTTSTEKAIIPRLDRYATKYDVTIGLHNHWFGESWFKGDRAKNFESPADWAEARKGRSEHIAINLDIGHFSAAGYDPVAFFREHHKRIVSVHVKDTVRDPDNTFTQFGEGKTPIAAFLKVAQELKYPHALNVEYELDEKTPTEGVRRSYEYVKKLVAGT
jgi:sugar phosphate isomerase/epimerase